jgi:hypothetical protein
MPRLQAVTLQVGSATDGSRFETDNGLWLSVHILVDDATLVVGERLYI